MDHGGCRLSGASGSDAGEDERDDARITPAHSSQARCHTTRADREPRDPSETHRGDSSMEPEIGCEEP